MGERIYNDPRLGPVRIVKSRKGRRISIRVHPARGIRVSVPFFVTYEEGLRFFMQKREWAEATLIRQRESLGGREPLSPEAVEGFRRQAYEYLPGRLAFLAAKYGFKYRKVFLKNNVSNWGSCSAAGNINLNVRQMMLPEYLRDYIMLHELCHLRHQDHSPAFHALLESLLFVHFNGALPEGIAVSRKAKYPFSHALETEMKKHHTSYV